MKRDATGAPLRIAGTLVDVSNRRQLEEQLRQAQKMEAVGRLAGGIAHDFNNMLTVILGNVQLLQTDDARPGLQEISKAATSAGTLTRQLLAFSRQAVLRPKVLNMNEVLRGTSSMLARLIGEDIRIHVVEGADLYNTRVDGVQIQEILLNLASNARDAMPGGGSLTLRTQNVSVGSERKRSEPPEPGDYVLLSVSDTGQGMDEATRSRAFEPFFTTKDVGQGTGLGLAMVFGIVAQSGGSIQIESALGAGTTFHLHFPRANASVEATAPAPGAVNGGSETVLLVEDELAVQNLCQRLLERAGYRVLATDSADRALEVWRASSQQIDLLLTDMVMPGMHGRALAEQLRSARASLPVLFMSGYPQDSRGNGSPAVDEGDFIQKPFTREVLLTKVRAILDTKR